MALSLYRLDMIGTPMNRYQGERFNRTYRDSTRCMRPCIHVRRRLGHVCKCMHTQGGAEYTGVHASSVRYASEG